jgi:peptide/nickel transport system substrate-binding protein
MNRCLILIGLFTVLSITINCKKNNETAVSKDSLTILYLGDERIFHQDYWGLEACFMVFSPLVSHAGRYSGEIKAVLAESWTHSDDYKTWTVKLRKDIFWHDGVQMTASDIKFTFELCNKVSSITTINCELIDDFTFKIITEKPLSSLPTWQVFYPKHLLEELNPSDYYSWDFWLQPIGSGPYKFVRNMPKAMVEVESNPIYFGGEPKIKKVILKFSQLPALQELLSGNVDAINYAPREFLFKIEGDVRYKSYYWWGSDIESLFWNHDNPLFKEAKVRRALTMSVNRRELSQVLNYPSDIHFTDVLYTRRQSDNKDIPAPISYDPNKAKKLLMECGWSDSNSDNILDKDGLDFEFKLTVAAEDNLMATYIQDNLMRIGVRVNIVTMEQSLVYQQLIHSDFEALIDSRFPNNENSIRRIMNFFGPDSYINYNNNKIDSILNLIIETGEKGEIDRLFKDLATIFEREIPITFLMPLVQTNIVKSEVKGLKDLDKADPVLFLESLWIE